MRAPLQRSRLTISSSESTTNLFARSSITCGRNELKETLTLRLCWPHLRNLTSSAFARAIPRRGRASAATSQRSRTGCPDFASVADKSFLSARAKVIGQIKNFVIDRTAKSSPDKLKNFFDQLRTVFDLTVVTLNYDDIIDRAGEWYNGFDKSTRANDAGAFDLPASPSNQCSTPPSCCTYTVASGLASRASALNHQGRVRSFDMVGQCAGSRPCFTRQEASHSPHRSSRATVRTVG